MHTRTDTHTHTNTHSRPAMQGAGLLIGSSFGFSALHKSASPHNMDDYVTAENVQSCCLVSRL